MGPNRTDLLCPSLRLLFIALAALALLTPAPASAGYVPIGTFGSAAQPAFTKAEGLAVDQSSGEVLVIDAGFGPGTGTLSRYHEDGTPADFSALATNVIDGSNTPEGALTVGGAGEVQVAVDDSGGATDGNIYLTQINAGPAEVDLIDVFASDGSLLGQLTESTQGPLHETCGVAVDPSGNLYVGDFGFSTGAIHKYEPAGAVPKNEDNVANFALPESCTLAAGSGPTGGSIFPTNIFTGEASKLNSASGAKAYEFGSGAKTVTVNPATGHVFTAGGSEVKEYDASGASDAKLVDSFSPGVAPTGVAVSETTGNVYVARSGNPNIEVWESVDLPEAKTEAATISAGTVTLHGTLSAAEGPPATCLFQYVEVHAEGFNGATSLPCSPAGPFTGPESEAVSAQIAALPEAAYRFRLLAENENGSTDGGTLFFTTFVESGLPDGRVYEMVSPPQKAGEVIPPEPVGQLGGSCGDCLPGINDRLIPMQSAPDGESVLYEGQPFAAGLAAGPNEYLAPRGPDGWGTQSLSSPTMTGQFLAFSADLSRSVLRQAEPTLSPEAPIRGGKGFANLYLLGGGAPQPLITAEPPNRDPGDFKLLFGAANAGTPLAPAFGHLVFEADDALTAADPGTAPAAPEVEAGECTLGAAECDLYEWEGGELRLINVLPGNTAAAAAVLIGSGRILAQTPTQSPDTAHAISDDGSRIFWSSEETGQVYVRIGGEETLEIPGPGSCKKSAPEEERACFLTASPDGSTVLLSNGTLYRLNEAGSAYLASADLSAGEGGFQGILGAAEDLSRVYFIDTKALTPAGETNGNGEHAEAAKFNLYGWDEGELAFIGRLASGDKAFGVRSYGAWAASPSQRTAQVSADGAQLAFMSLARLTGYDNTARGGGNCGRLGIPTCREVFVYSADSGTLSCASCNPTGEQPLGPSNLSLIRPDGPFPQPGNLSRDGSGRLFFESQDALVSRDVNGHIQDVYEWEPNGAGSCNREAGCVYLISSGQSPDDSIFLDSSDSGEDAFFITRERVLPRDKDEQLDLYDARVGGGIAEPNAIPCDSGDACLGSPSSPPLQQSPGTPGHFGPGNPPKPCKKGFVRKHGKCVKKPKKSKKPKKHHRRAHKRQARPGREVGR